MFIARETELKKLNKRYQGGDMEFIVLYGRRRVGKTALINEFVKDKPAIYYSAINANAKDNLAILSKAIYVYEKSYVNEPPVFPSFEAAFNEIGRLAQNERVVFVIDELPYLAKSDESIISRLQHLLDYQWSNTKLFFIVCGSSISFMQKEVLSEKSPLFGRRTAQFHIQPFDYYDSYKMNPDLSEEESSLIYGITGGIPHYINKLQVTSTIKDALLKNFFDTSSYLFEEPANLLKQELREPGVYNSIIAAIATGATRLNEISSRVGMDTGKCMNYIKPLMELGIIAKTEPIVNMGSRRGVYQISDNFFRFWFRFVPENISAINADKMYLIYDQAVAGYLSDFMGNVFETMCRQYLIRNMELLPFSFSKIGKWWGTHYKLKKEVELDIVAISPKGNNTVGNEYLIGSCKYTSNRIGTDELELIREYASAFVTDNDICHYYIFSKSGFTNSLLNKQKAGEVTLISLKDMYRYANKLDR